MPDAAVLRLGRLLLGYMAAVVLLIVLAPFRFDLGLLEGAAWYPLGQTEPGDTLMNVVLYLPLGFLLDRVLGGRRGPWFVVVVGALFSGTSEALQLVIPGRYPAVSDVVANALGAGLGAWASVAMRRELRADARLIGRLFLDLPLVGLCWLLVPLAWLVALSATTTGRVAVLVPVAAAVGLALAAAGRSGSSGRWPLLMPVALGWGVIALFPSAVIEPLMAAVAFLTLMVTLVGGDRWWGRPTRKDRRVEPGAALAVAVLLLPWLVTTDPGVGSLDWAIDDSTLRVYALSLVEVLVGGTAVGYVLAEWRGRSEVRGVRAGLLPVGVALALMVATHWPVTLERIGLVALAAALGSGIYLLQRDAVVALRTAAVANVGEGEPAPT